MRKLTRASVAPPCLANYQHGTQTWEHVTPEHKAEVRDDLEAMQGRRCAYCEGDLDVLGNHIEHFRRRRTYPALTFEWSNLFWSCSKTDCCGHYKDNGAGPYDVADLVNPCVDDPDDFFVFRSDGTINLRRGLSSQNEKRARETLRVFSLDAEWGRLRSMRKTAVSIYVSAADEAVSAGFTPGEIAEYFEDALNQARALPFYTTIRHVLTERQ